MPKLIIPNRETVGLKEPVCPNPSVTRYNFLYSYRFLWLLEPGDIILLHEKPDQAFLEYLAEIKQLDLASVHLITLRDKPELLYGDVILNQNLIDDLKKIIIHPTHWSILPYVFNQDIVNLTEALGINVDQQFLNLMRQDFAEQMNSKTEFRRLMAGHDLPLTEGMVCNTLYNFKMGLKKYLDLNDILIIKQEYGSGGGGNIGICLGEEKPMLGVRFQYTVSKNEVDNLAEKIWSKFTNQRNPRLVIEVYYPSARAITNEIWIPSQGKPSRMLNYCEMRMEPTWVGFEMPAHNIKPFDVTEFTSVSMKIADILQSHGYYGYMSCDAIKTQDEKMLFNEINVRLGGGTHIHVIAQKLWGDDYLNKRTFLTRNHIGGLTFSQLFSLLKEHGLSFSTNDLSGVMIMTADEYTMESEYMIVGYSKEQVWALENKLLGLLQDFTHLHCHLENYGETACA